MTTIREALDVARRKLAEVGIETAALDARLLLQYAAGLSHENIVANSGQPLGARAAGKLQGLMARREAHEPVSRILGEREFLGRVFRVTPAVLDPRPETEVLVGEALKQLKPGARVLDIGTGSGAIIVSLLAECPGATGVATDISQAALEVARLNAQRLGVAKRLQWLHCSWFEGVAGRFDLIVSNPPYIPWAAIAALPASVRGFDPHWALDGGPDGLEAYRRLAAGAGGHLA
ncbi:MAG: peptide chain release factor N(5)-glutamine methyltransferase, partial [Methylocella sp.]